MFSTQLEMKQNHTNTTCLWPHQDLLLTANHHMQRSSYPLSTLFHFLQKNKSSSSSSLSTSSNAQLQSFRPKSSNLKTLSVRWIPFSALLTSGAIRGRFTWGQHRAVSSSLSACYNEGMVSGHSSTALQGGGHGAKNKLCYLQSPSMRDVRKVRSEVERSKVSGG